MADVKTAVVRAAMNTGTGTQDFTKSGFGTPKAAIFYLTKAVTDATVANDALISIGFAASATDRAAMGFFTEDNLTTSNTDSTRTSTGCVFAKDDTTILVKADFDSFITDGIRIDISTPPAAGWLLHVVLFGGADLSADVGIVAPGTDTTITDVTAPGFEPDLVFAIHGDGPFDEATNDARVGFGCAMNDVGETQHCFTWLDRDAKTTTAAIAHLSTIRVAMRLSSGGAVTYGATVSDYDANGFSITANSNWGPKELAYLALAFGGGGFHVAIQDAPTATGNDSETGAGFKPQLALRIMSDLATLDTSILTGAAGAASFSQLTANEEFCLGVHFEDAQTTTNTGSLSASKAIHMINNGGGNAYVGTFTSFDADGDTINYTVTEGTVKKWIWIAIEEGGGTVFNVTGSGGAVTGGSATVALITVGQPIVMAEDNKFRHKLESPSAPAVAREGKTSIQASDAMTDTYQASSVLDVAEAREVTLLVKHNAGGAGNIPELLVLFSDQDARPLTTDDVWYIPNETDGSITAALPGGTVLPSADFTLTPEFARVTVRPLHLRMETTDGAADELRLAITLKCTWAKWVHVQYVDNSGTTLGAIIVDAVRTV